ncbi:MAG: LPS export ABC transporter periplasmic protein LptC [Myxococcota bacterium]
MQLPHAGRPVSVWLTVLALAPWLAVSAAAEAPVLDIEGMRFTTSEGGVNELVLESESARFDTVGQLAFLQAVRARVAPSGEHEGFAMTCERGVLDLSTNDFRFRGNVVGRTDDGRRFAARWVRYQHEQGLLYTDDSVLITEASGTSYRGGGFRYYVKERRFRLLGGATLVQEGP